MRVRVDSRMSRRFSRSRLAKLFLTLAIFFTVAIIFLSVFSQYYVGVTRKQYRAKTDYCWEKGGYAYKISECSDQEYEQWLLWLNISQITPKILATLVMISLLGFGVYKYLFPKVKR